MPNKEVEENLCVLMYILHVLYVRQKGYMSQHPHTPCYLPDQEELLIYYPLFP